MTSESATGRGVGRRLDTPRAAGIAGLVFSLLFVVAILLSRRHPAPGSTAEEIASFYLDQDAGRVVLLGLYLIPFAGIAFLWFIAAIRAHLGEREDRFFATVFLGSGLLFVGMLFTAAAAAGSLLAAVKYRDQPVPGPDTVMFARALAFAFLFVFGVRAAAVFGPLASAPDPGAAQPALPRLPAPSTATSSTSVARIHETSSVRATAR